MSWMIFYKCYKLFITLSICSRRFHIENFTYSCCYSESLWIRNEICTNQGARVVVYNFRKMFDLISYIKDFISENQTNIIISNKLFSKIKAFAIPLGASCALYARLSSIWEPSPSSCWMFGMSSALESIQMSFMPNSIKVDSGYQIIGCRTQATTALIAQMIRGYKRFLVL